MEETKVGKEVKKLSFMHRKGMKHAISQNIFFFFNTHCSALRTTLATWNAKSGIYKTWFILFCVVVGFGVWGFWFVFGLGFFCLFFFLCVCV